jgi:serine/threonine-protein phosphatase 2A regulatory subunit B''
MAYEDFVAFYMSEEDKTSEAALRYWFGVADVDGDGVLSASDLRYFYRCVAREGRPCAPEGRS